jgi:hypothetical protein
VQNILEVIFLTKLSAKTFRDRRTAKRESASQPSTSNAATDAGWLMQLHVEMRSANPDMDVDGLTGSVWGPT